MGGTSTEYSYFFVFYDVTPVHIYSLTGVNCLNVQKLGAQIIYVWEDICHIFERVKSFIAPFSVSGEDPGTELIRAQ